MVTIYEEFLKRKSTKRLGKELTSIMNEKLTQLLKDTCNIDLSGTDSPFSQWHFIDLHDLHPHPRFTVFNDGVMDVNFHFKNGSATIMLYPKRKVLTVAFHFNKLGCDLMFPYDSKSCFVTVDHDMNFIEAQFRINFCLFKSTIDKTDSSRTSSMVSIQVNHDNQGDVKTQFIYGNNLYATLLKDLSAHGLSPAFFNSDESFNLILSRFMKVNTEHPDMFYDEFKEYISYQELMSSVNSMVYFLNMFAEQYNNDLYLLTSRLMLIEMRNI